MSNDRIISPAAQPEDSDGMLRPQRLKDILGQERVIESLQIAVEAAKARHDPLEHQLFYGPPGLGKTTLAHVMANEMGVNLKISAGPAIERAGDLAAILTNLKGGDIFFIDEIHRLGHVVEEILYPAMEDFKLDIVTGKGPGAKNLRLALPKFTVVGATTRLASLTTALQTRFVGVYHLEFYSSEIMAKIVARASRVMGVAIEPGGAVEIGKRARGTPRVGIRLLKRVRDYAQVRANGIITAQVADEALDLAGVDPLGLDDIDRRVLLAIIDKFSGGPVGLDTIAASIGEEADTIEDVCEPYLLQIGFLERTPRGRMATRRAYEHLQVPYNRLPRQGDLFGLPPDQPDVA